MIRETYKGRKLTARKGRQWGTVEVTVNGEHVWQVTSRDETAEVASVKRWIDSVDAKPVDGNAWGAHWYAPGTYEMCPKEIHPQEIGGQCQHFTCIRDRAGAH